MKRQAPQLNTPQAVRLPFTIAALDEARVERAQGPSVDVLRVTGHASVFDYEYKVFGGPPWGWVERIERGAFDATLAEQPDVVFLRNHEGMPLARTKSGTLQLEIDDIGLAMTAELDLANPEVRALASALSRGDVDEMSFAFRVTEQMWAEHPDWEGDEMSLRKITAVNLNRGDVSAVTYGASDATDIDIMRSLDRLDLNQLAEARAAIDRRLGSSDTTPGAGCPGEQTRSGTPGDVLAALAIPPNPLLERYAREQGSDSRSAGPAHRAS